jgi:CBS domain containing-hemolysin-like protein
MVCLYLEDSFEESLQTMKKAHHTRFPLCGEDKDDVRGIIHIRDAYEMVFSQKKKDLTEIAREVVMVPETMEIKDVLRKLQKNKTGMAIVVDEYGGTSGLISTEDIIEEIFGEIQDEFDNSYFQLELEDDNNDTIGGWLYSRLNKIPEIGDAFEYGGYLFEVLEVKNRSIHRILVKPLSQKEKITTQNEET